MATDIFPEAGVLAKVDLDRPRPKPKDCLPPGEQPLATASLSTGWIAVTDREFLAFRPDDDPALVRADRPNVIGLAVRRAGGRTFLRYVPAAAIYAVAASVFGVLLLAISPEQFIAVPDAPGAGSLETIVLTLGWAMGILGSVLLFTGILAALIAIVVPLHWLFSNEVTFVIERSGSDPIECPTTRADGTRALRELKAELEHSTRETTASE